MIHHLTVITGKALGNQRIKVCRTEEQKKAVLKVVEMLEEAGGVQGVDYTGTSWRLLFSTSTTESAGKLGPFTGRVGQACLLH